MPLANVFAPMGFLPKDSGSRIGMNTRQRPVPAARVTIGAAASADLAIGDAYGIDANGNAYHVGADGVVRGVVIGFNLQAVSTIMNGNGPISEDYIAAAASGAVIGVEDNDAEFMVQADTFAATQVGKLVNMVDAAPDPTLRQSRQSITTGADGTQFKITELLNSPADNVYGANAVVCVRINGTAL